MSPFPAPNQINNSRGNPFGNGESTFVGRRDTNWFGDLVHCKVSIFGVLCAPVICKCTLIAHFSHLYHPPCRPSNDNRFPPQHKLLLVVGTVLRVAGIIKDKESSPLEHAFSFLFLQIHPRNPTDQFSVLCSPSISYSFRSAIERKLWILSAWKRTRSSKPSFRI